MDYIYRKTEDIGIFYTWFEAMHTRIDFIMWNPLFMETDFCHITNITKDEISRIEKFANCFNPKSELFSINETAANCWKNVSKELCDILLKCLYYSIHTDGLFDIAANNELKGIPAHEKYEVDVENCRVRRLHNSSHLNLSGFIKGYTLSKVINKIIPSDLKNGMFNFGNSSIYCMGNHPKGEGWIISNSTEINKKYLLKNNCLTTSGNVSSERKHIINPYTGNFVRGKHQVSVITEDPEYGEVKSIVEFIKKFSYF